MRMGEGGAQSWLVLVYRTGPVLRVLTFIRTVAVCLAPVALNWFGLYALHSTAPSGVIAIAAGEMGHGLFGPQMPGPAAPARCATAPSSATTQNILQRSRQLGSQLAVGECVVPISRGSF